MCFCRYCNESSIGVTSLEWYPDTGDVDSGQDGRCGLYFADKEGYIGWFQGAWPVRQGGREGVRDDLKIASSWRGFSQMPFLEQMT